MQPQAESRIVRAVQTPFTLAITLASVVISLNWWAGGHWADPLATRGDLMARPWTVLTSTLPHVNAIHLLFNLSWWWPFGSRVERVWGAGHAAILFGVLAILSNAAEYALLRGGVGLSGVVYGLCTLLWVVQDKVPGLGGVVARSTLQLFAVWFVICIVLTVTNVVPIGNVAHGAGALAGWLLGKFIVAGPMRRGWATSLVIMAALVGIGATAARPWVNLSTMFEDDAYRGFVALMEGRPEEGVRLLEAAARESPGDPNVAFNLGLAYHEVNRPRDAVATFMRVVQLDSSRREEVAPFIAEIFDQQAAEAAKQGDFSQARGFAEASLEWAPDDEYARELIAWLDDNAGDATSMPAEP